MTPLEICEYARGIYSPVPAGMFDKTFEVGCVVFGHAKVGDVDVLALRGSENADDWFHDLTFIPEWHRQLGFVHAGFLHDMDDVFAAVRGIVGSKVIITGHSLGGARARILAALFAYNGVPVDTVCVFGSPKPAFTNLARIIQKSSIKHLSFRNRNDIVPCMPLTIEPFLDFVHTEDWMPISAAPAETNLEPLRDHGIDLYAQGLAVP